MNVAEKKTDFYIPFTPFLFSDLLLPFLLASLVPFVHKRPLSEK